MVILMIALLYIGMMVYLANLEQMRGESHPLLKIMQYSLVFLIGVWVLNALVFVFLTPEQVADPQLADQLARVDALSALGFVVFGSLAMLAIVSLIRSPILHQWIEQYLYRKSKDDLRTYDSTLSVHKLAVMLVIVQVVVVMWTFILSGGIEGLDFSYESSLLALGDVAGGAVLYSVLALLGVGWMVRRTLPEILQRLGIRFPTRRDWIMGIGMALLLYLVLILVSTIWTALVSPEVLEQQTAASQQLFEAFNSSLILGFLLALLTGISEEMLFRGALQPVFGWIPTSIFFTIIHIQYTLTPATLIIFIVSLGFGWLRKQVSTTSAMIAHITYNFIPFLLFTIFTNTGVV